MECHQGRSRKRDDLLKGALDGIWTLISGAVTLAWGGLVTTITGKAKDIYDAVWAKIDALRTTLTGFWTTITDNATSGWGGFIDAIKGAMSNIWEKVFKDPWLRVQGYFGQIVSNLRTWISGVFDNIHIPTPHFRVNIPSVAAILAEKCRR